MNRVLARPGAVRRLDHRQAHHLDKTGRHLWNTCIRLTNRGSGDLEGFMPEARLLAFCLVELGRVAAGRDLAESDTSYLLRLALALAWNCLLGREELQSARSALQKAAGYVGQLGSAESEAGKKMQADYLALRIILVCRSSSSTRTHLTKAVVERELPGRG